MVAAVRSLPNICLTSPDDPHLQDSKTLPATPHRRGFRSTPPPAHPPGGWAGGVSFFVYTSYILHELERSVVFL